MDNSLSEPKIALVTGAAKRVGERIVRHLHGNGWRLVIHCRHSREAADVLSAELNGMRADSAVVIQADLLDAEGMASCVTQLQAQTGHLDLLVNNASSFYPTPVGEVSEQQWHDLLGSNLKAPFFLTQALLPLLKTSQGSVVNIVDIHAQRPMLGFPVYSVAKAGLLAMTQALARELAPEVRVNGVSPGAILWPDPEPQLAAKNALLEKIPMGRLGDPDDIAKAVCFLAEDAGYVTGQVIAVDGGRSVSI